MAKGKPFKLTQESLKYLNVERDAASAGLVRLERAGLIQVERRPGQRPTISMEIRPADSEGKATQKLDMDAAVGSMPA